MSGGVAYIYNEAGNFAKLYNSEMIEIVPLDEQDEATLQDLMAKHVTNTGSKKAAALLAGWPEAMKHFIRVQPIQPKPAPAPAPELAAASK